MVSFSNFVLWSVTESHIQIKQLSLTTTYGVVSLSIYARYRVFYRVVYYSVGFLLK